MSLISFKTMDLAQFLGSQLSLFFPPVLQGM